MLAGPHPPALTGQPRATDDDVAGAETDRGDPRRPVATRARLRRRAPLRRACDARLVELSRAGDQRAFEAIIERYRPLLLAHCRSVAGEAGQDAVQQAFVSAWCALLSGGEVRHLRAWLFAIAHRAALRALDDQGTPLDAVGPELAGGRSPEEHLEQSTHVRETLAAVAGLPPRERDALVWTSIQGRSGSDVARELGVSEMAARQLVFRARARARAALSALVPPALSARMPALVGHSARRALALVHRVPADASSMEASGALVRLASVLVTGALVAAPVAAVELGGHPGVRPPARAAKASPAEQGRALAGRSGAGPSPAPHAGGVPRGTRAANAVRQAQPAAGAPAPSSEGGNRGVPAGGARSPAQARGPERHGGVASLAVAGLAPAALATQPGRDLTPVAAPALSGLAGATEAIGPGAVAAAGAAQSATGGVEGPLRRGAGPVQAPPAGAPQNARVSGGAAPSAGALP